jgi:hypothetical protein
MPDVTEEEIVLSDGGDEEEDEDEDMMMDGNPLEDFLVSDDGDNVANVLAKGFDRVCQQLDIQNKIFVKLYTVLSKVSASTAQTKA